MTSEQIFDHARTAALALMTATVFVVALVQMPQLAIAMLIGFAGGCVTGGAYILWQLKHSSPFRERRKSR